MFTIVNIPDVTQEEAGIDAPLTQCGLLFFKSVDMDFAHKIYIFQADEYSGTVTELSCPTLCLLCIVFLNVQSRSEEMRPQWFTIGADASDNGIPFDKMWADDRFAISQSSRHESADAIWFK